MPIDPITITAGAAAAGSLINAGQTGRMNRKSRQFSREMYDKTKQDNIAFWNMQNEYNSPQAQMKRLQEAGLNPNLVYGSGQAQQAAGNISTPDVQSPQWRTPEYGNSLQNLSQYFDFEIKQAQVDNLKAQTANTQEQTLLNIIRQDGEYWSNLSTQTKAKLDTELMEVSADSAREKLRQLKIQNQYQTDEAERAILMFEPRLQNAVEDILTKRLGREVSQQQLRNAGLDQEVKELDARLARMGIRPTDPFYFKAVGGLIGAILQKIDPSAYKIYKEFQTHEGNWFHKK